MNASCTIILLFSCLFQLSICSITGYAVGASIFSGNTYLYARDGNGNWNVIYTFQQTVLTSLFFQSDTSTLFTAGFLLDGNFSPFIASSADLGITWADATTTDDTGYQLQQIIFPNSKVGISVGANFPSILVSSDGGKTWNDLQISNDGDFSVHHISSYQNNLVLIGFDNDNGSSQVFSGNAQNMQFNLQSELEDVLLHSSTYTPKGSQILIGEIQNFTGSYGIMIRDGINYIYDETVFSGNVAFINENIGYAIGHGESVFVTDDGVNWEDSDIPYGLRVQFHDIAVTSAGSVWVAGTGEIISSQDGIHWNLELSAPTLHFGGIVIGSFE